MLALVLAETAKTAAVVPCIFECISNSTRDDPENFFDILSLQTVRTTP